ncbi:MAG TPA: hypothetical protein DIU15_11295 [Deltaproteobacteria bacterium]|nr:hypothetical protein [Deltaproteobacteria bacterium]HCP46623.1 hypothetical protein [Deltaproteobacteria bacterium]
MDSTTTAWFLCGVKAARMRSLLLFLGLAVVGTATGPKTAFAAGETAGLDPLASTKEAPRSRKKVRVAETPEQLYNRGLRQMRRGYYDEAVLSFDKVRNHFPFNQYSVLAELRVADCLYEKSAFAEAVDAYRQFARLHPRHPEVDYVVYRIARSEFKLAPSVAQRDQSHTVRGLKRLKGFVERFPDSIYLEEVQRLREKAELRLVRRATQVGHFYWKRKAWKAAERRYRLAYEQFPDSKLAVRCRYRQAVCLWNLGRQQEARTALEALAARDPESRTALKARRFLDKREVSPAPVEGDPQPTPESLPSQ